MSICVVIAAYNAARFLGPTIQSVLAQDQPDWRLVVVDDGSHDETFSIAQDFARRDERIRAVTQPNGGSAATGRNRGFAERPAATDRILFLDHDDLLLRDALSSLAASLDAHQTAPAVCGLARYIDADGDLLWPGESERYTREGCAVEGDEIRPMPAAAPIRFAMLAYRNHILTPGQVLIRAFALEQVGLFDVDLRFVSDWDLWLRLSRIAPIPVVDRVVLNYRRHSGNQSREVERVRRGAEAMLRQWLDNPDVTGDERRMLWTGAKLLKRDGAKQWLRWARASLLRGDAIEAAKQLRHAALSYAEFLRARERR